MKVIIINGMATAGKSTFVKLCKEVYPHTYELSMIDFAKAVARFIGWKGEKTEKSRKFLADLKDAIDNYDGDIIYEAIEEKIVGCIMNSSKEPVFFINARSPEDIEYLKSKYRATTLFITNPRVLNVTTNHADAHVNDYSYDVYIENDGMMEEFGEKAKKFMEEIVNAD